MIQKIINEIENNNLEEAINLIIDNENTLKDNAEYWSVRGFVCCLTAQYSTAIECFLEAIQKDLKDADMFYNLAFCYEQLGYKDLALLNSVISVKLNINSELNQEIKNKYIDSKLFTYLLNTDVNNLEHLINLNKNTLIVNDTISNSSNLNIFLYLQTLETLGTKEFIECIKQDTNIDSHIKEELLHYTKKKNTIPIKILTYISGAAYSKAKSLALSINDTLECNHYLALANYYSNELSEPDIIQNALKYINIYGTKILTYKKFLQDCSLNGYCVIDLTNSLYEKTEMLQVLLNKVPNIKYICSGKSVDINGFKHVPLTTLYQSPNLKPLVIWDEINYVPQVRALAEYGIKECSVIVLRLEGYEIIPINKVLMNKIKNKEYLTTLSVCKRYASDGNVEAVLRNVPPNMKHYKIHMVDFNEVTSISSIVLTPLISSVTLDGFGKFSSHPKSPYVKHLDVWHAGMGVKAIGLLDKNEANPYIWTQLYKNADKICLPSDMSVTLYAALFGLPQSKFVVTGTARNDLLLTSNGTNNLEKIFGDKIKNKKIIFNLPTFRINSDSGRVEGDKRLLGTFKLTNFDFEKFDKFLELNNVICISKSHHVEKDVVLSSTPTSKFKNILFITDTDLDKHSLNLYDVLNGADMLITDYSSSATDFIFMNKPVIYSVEDFEEYKNTKGFALHPFDFWNPGFKTKTQDELQSAIQTHINNPSLYEKERKTLIPLYFNTTDFGASYNVWSIIDDLFKSVNK